MMDHPFTDSNLISQDTFLFNKSIVDSKINYNAQLIEIVTIIVPNQHTNSRYSYRLFSEDMEKLFSEEELFAEVLPEEEKELYIIMNNNFISVCW